MDDENKMRNLHNFLFPKCADEKNFLQNQIVLQKEAINVSELEKKEFQKLYGEELINFRNKIELAKGEQKCLVIPVLVGEKASTLNVLIPKCKYSELLEDIYHVPRLEDVKAFLEWSKINKEKWVAQENDCDDRSRRLWVEAKNWWPLVSFGFCTLTLKTYRHAANWFIAYDGGKMGIWFCEPSDDSVWKGKYPGTLSNDLLMM